MRCPTCNLEFDLQASSAKPFCSKRCKTIDLGRWLDESHALPAVPNIEADEIPDDNWSGQPIGTDALTDAEESTDV